MTPIEIKGIWQLCELRRACKKVIIALWILAPPIAPCSFYFSTKAHLLSLPSYIASSIILLITALATAAIYFKMRGIDKVLRKALSENTPARIV
jgi:hypothetical protein